MKEKNFDINPLLSSGRHVFSRSCLLEKDCAANPFVQFEYWLKEAFENGDDMANAMTLSTVDQNGVPDSRIVLLKDLGYNGLTFFTNYQSKKGTDLAANPHARLLFFWKELQRQVRICGKVNFVPAKESDNYFASRSFENKIGALVSQQSKVIQNRGTMDNAFDDALMQYTGKEITRPDHWGGYVLLPMQFEFWQGRPGRLHDRIRYTYEAVHKTWAMDRLMP